MVTVLVVFAIALAWSFWRGWREAKRKAEAEAARTVTVTRTVIVREPARPRARRPRRRP